MSNENNIIKFPINENMDDSIEKIMETNINQIIKEKIIADSNFMETVKDSTNNTSETSQSPTFIGIDEATGEDKSAIVVINPPDQQAVAEEQPPEPPLLDENDPLNEVSQQQLSQMMSQIREMMGLFEAQWNSTQQEFKLTEGHMKQLHAYNEEHAQPMPLLLTEEEQAKWDRFNGLNSITEEKALEIFGNDHPIIGIEHTITIDRIKSVTQDFFSWMATVTEYRNIYNAYTQLIELQEEKEIETLKQFRDNEQDPEKKAKMAAAIDLYYSRKYLEFLAEPLSEEKINILVKAFSNENKIEYWINRSRTKLNQMKISSKFILEISQFEKRFLPEEYHHQNNIFLLYFMNLLVYCDVYDKKSADRNKVACLIFGMDKFIRNMWSSEIREKISNNMIEFQKQFLGKLPIKKEGTNE